MNNKEIEQEQLEMQESFNKYLIENNRPPETFKFVAIGYLDFQEPYEKGIVSQNFLNKLRILWSEGITLGSLGHHDCSFCIDEGNYETRATSSSEKILIDKENKIQYIFPEMIFHYIEIHKFKPSNKFIEFVIRN